MKQNIEQQLNTAENIGYKCTSLNAKFIYVLICSLICIICSFIGFLSGLKISGYYAFLIIISVLLLIISIRRIISNKQAPDCIIKKNDTTLFFWYKEEWNSIPLSDISYVYISTGKYNRHNGDIILHTSNKKYIVCDVKDFDEVKMKIGVYRK